MLTFAESFGIVIKSVATRETNGILAQLGEHLPYKQGVIGSSPIGPISFYPTTFSPCGEIAQLARARGSYPRCRGFESPSRYDLESIDCSVLFCFIENYQLPGRINNCLCVFYKTKTLREDAQKSIYYFANYIE